MIKTTIEKLAKEIGFDIGCSDDVTQGEMLNAFSEGLKMSCRDKLDDQLCYLSKKLDKNSRFVIEALCEFIKLEEDK